MASTACTEDAERDEDECSVADVYSKAAKELKAKIQTLKKISIPKSDKARKKQVAAEIASLQLKLEEIRKQKQVTNISKEKNEKDEVLSLEQKLECVDITSQPDATKVSRAKKKKERRARKEKERDERIAAATVEDADNVRVQERAKLESILSPLRLCIKDISPDGNCLSMHSLYAAVGDQLNTRLGVKVSVDELRSQCADYIRTHSDQFLPFLTDPNTGDPLTEEQFQQYCDDIQHTTVWGGQLELRAMSEIHLTPVMVYQADAPPLCIGNSDGHPSERMLLVSYHHHEYSLGQHYNSIVPAVET